MTPELRDRHLLPEVLHHRTINLVLIGINLIQSPDYLWALWVAGGWGCALLIKAFRIFGPDWMLGAEWEKRQVEKRLGRPL